MNGHLVVVFVDGIFDCVMVAPTRDTALAWSAGASFGARHFGGSGLAAIVVPREGRTFARAMRWLKHELDEEMVIVARSEVDRAREALRRAFSMKFSPLVTIVK